jgi:hypothetical protein
MPSLKVLGVPMAAERARGTMDGMGRREMHSKARVKEEGKAKKNQELIRVLRLGESKENALDVDARIIGLAIAAPLSTWLSYISSPPEVAIGRITTSPTSRNLLLSQTLRSLKNCILEKMLAVMISA